MLKTLRASAHSIFVKLLMGVLVLMFGIWGVGDILRNSGGAGSIASVGRTTISLQQYRIALRERQDELRQMLGKSYSPALIKRLGLERQVLISLVREALISKEAQAMGLDVNDSDVADAIRKSPEFQDRFGRFDKSLYMEMLRNRDMAAQSYEAVRRKEVASAFLSDTMSVPPPVPEALMEALYRVQEEQRAANVTLITANALSGVPAPTDKDLETYYAAHDKEFLTPELRTVTYVQVKPKASADAKAGAPDDQEAVYKLVGNLEDELAGGATLESAASKIGETPVSVGPFTKDGVGADGRKVTFPGEGNFLNTAFSVAEKEQSQAVQISDGSYLLLRVDAITPEHARPLSEVKPQLIAAWKQQKASELLRKAGEEISADITKGVALKDTLAAHHINASAVSVGKLKRSSETTTEGVLAKKPLSRPMVLDLFRLKPGESTHAYMAGPDALMVATLTQVYAAPDIHAPDSAKTVKELHNRLQESLAQEMIAHYLEYLESKYHVTVNEAALNAGSKDDTGE